MPAVGDYEAYREELELQLMESDIAKKRASAALKDEQRRWEPWKALSAAFAAGVAVATTLGTLYAWALSHFIR